MSRADANNNPAAFTTAIASEAGLVFSTDYVQGDPFTVGGATYYTAKLLGDPVAITIRVIDAIGYKTKAGVERWTYISIPKFVWNSLTSDEKRDVIGYHYQYEGGIALRGLFPSYGMS